MATVTAVRNKTQSRTAMSKVMRYVSQAKKTLLEQDQTRIQLLSGKDCLAETAFQEFMATKRQYDKETGRYFYQYIQSFPPGENATPQQIHQMGLELAEYFKGHGVLIATHIDRDHQHNHLIVNSVSHATGLKLQFNEQNFNQFRKLSDQICQAHGLEVLAPYQKQKEKSLTTREYRAAEKGASWKFALMGTIDACMARSRSRQEFVGHMRSFGYNVNFNDGPKRRISITYTTPTGMKCRDNKLHEPKYLKENMQFEFRLRESQIQQYAIGPNFAADEAVLASGIRHPTGAMGRDRADFAVNGNTVSEHQYEVGIPAGRGNISEVCERGNALAGQPDGEAHRQDYGTGEQDRSDAGAIVTTGWEASRQQLYEMQRTDGIAFEQAPMADLESIPVHGFGGNIAGDVIRLARNISQIAEYDDDLSNIAALAALAGISVAGAYKLVEAIKDYELTDQQAEETLSELQFEQENLEEQPSWEISMQ